MGVPSIVSSATQTADQRIGLCKHCDLQPQDNIIYWLLNLYLNFTKLITNQIFSIIKNYSWSSLEPPISGRHLCPSWNRRQGRLFGLCDRFCARICAYAHINNIFKLNILIRKSTPIPFLQTLLYTVVLQKHHSFLWSTFKMMVRLLIIRH